MSGITVAEAMGIPAGMYEPPDVTDLPPLSLLPRAIHPLVKARDAAWDRYSDLEAEHYELVGLDWERHFAQLDEAAGRQAVADGVDPLSVPSALEAARTRRPRVMGALRALAAEVTRTDHAVCDAIRAELPAIGKAIEATVEKASAAYVDAQRAADEARAAYGAALTGRAWHLRSDLRGTREHWAGATEAIPVDVNSGEIRDDHGRPMRGAAEVNAIDRSYRGVYREPRVKIRSLVNGYEFEAKESHAAGMVANGTAEYVSA